MRIPKGLNINTFDVVILKYSSAASAFCDPQEDIV